MSLRSSLRATPTLLRVGFSEAIAYRAELLIWILATTMPLVMLALFSTVAREAPIGRFTQADVVAYFLATFVVRQLTGSWAAWQIAMEVRGGTLSTRLLRPLHPLWAYAMEGLAGLPLRAAFGVPLAAIALVWTSSSKLTHAPAIWACFTLAVLFGWAITFLINVILGCMSLWIESSLRLVDLYLVFFFVFSGYLVPIEVFPPTLRAIANVLPFRFQIAFPVELLTARHSPAHALELLGAQLAWVLGLLATALFVFRRGLARFGAFGG
ncbi:MAG: ABC transporter permease [Polyangiales bacterium]